MDVDLNPRLGLDWMRRGRQKRVLTPGNNQKRDVAGALTIGSGKLTWAFGARKDSDLVIAALAALLRRYRRYRRLHVIVKEVDHCLAALSPYPGSPASLRPALSSPVADSGSAIHGAAVIVTRNDC
jgi:hypothetical protein